MAFMSQFKTLSNDEIEIIADNINIQLVKKGTILMKEGQICETCYFVLKGCLRQYLIVNGIEKTTQFFTEEQAAVQFSNYLNGEKSESYLVCAEDSVLIIGEINQEKKMYQEFPVLEKITRMMIEQNLGKSQDEFTRFITNSPEERYLFLLKNRPDLLQRVPQHQLASYIGVTPESLSRIRKRTVFKNHTSL